MELYEVLALIKFTSTVVHCKEITTLLFFDFTNILLLSTSFPTISGEIIVVIVLVFWTFLKKKQNEIRDIIKKRIENTFTLFKDSLCFSILINNKITVISNSPLKIKRVYF